MCTALVLPCPQLDPVIKGEFPVSRVEVVETMAYEVFHRENVLQVTLPNMGPPGQLSIYLPPPLPPSHRLVMTMRCCTWWLLQQRSALNGWLLCRKVCMRVRLRASSRQHSVHAAKDRSGLGWFPALCGAGLNG